VFLLPDRVAQFNISVYDNNTMSDSIMAAVTLKLGQIPANTDVPLQPTGTLQLGAALVSLPLLASQNPNELIAQVGKEILRAGAGDAPDGGGEQKDAGGGGGGAYPPVPPPGGPGRFQAAGALVGNVVGVAHAMQPAYPGGPGGAMPVVQPVGVAPAYPGGPGGAARAMPMPAYPGGPGGGMPAYPGAVVQPVQPVQPGYGVVQPGPYGVPQQPQHVQPAYGQPQQQPAYGGYPQPVQGGYGQPDAGMQAAIAAVQQQEAAEARFAQARGQQQQQQQQQQQADAQRRRQQDEADHAMAMKMAGIESLGDQEARRRRQAEQAAADERMIAEMMRSGAYQ